MVIHLLLSLTPTVLVNVDVVDLGMKNPLKLTSNARRS
jgi:hypothetical protein